MIDSRGALLLGNFLSGVTGVRGIGEDLADRLSEAGWRVFTASSKRRRIFRSLDMAFTIICRRHFYTVAHIEVYSGLAFVWAEFTSVLLSIVGKKYVLTLHGGNLPTFAERHPRRVRRLLQTADAVTTPSSYLKETFSDVRDDIILLRNAIDLSSYDSVPRTNAKPRFAWLRAFHTIYSPCIAAETLGLLAKEYPDIELTMFGPDKGDGSLQTVRETAQRLDISDRIYTPGAIPKSEVPQRLAPFDIFLNTTTAESFGVSVMEAAALGMCIVTTNVGELPYIWTHEHDALLVPPNDPQAMADAIRRILTEPGLAERLSRNARAKAEQFDWSVILPQWEELLLDVIERHQRGRRS